MRVNPELGSLVRRAVVEHLRGQGMQATERDDEIELGFGDVTCRVEVDPPSEPEILPVWFRVRHGLAAAEIEVSIAGVGASSTEAAAQAAHAFAIGVVLPLRKVFAPESGGVTALRMTSKTDTEKPVAWDVFVGEPSLIGSEGAPEDLARDLESAVAGVAPLEQIIDDVTGLLHEVRLHWAKLFLLRFPDGRMTGEVALDNIASAEAFEHLKGLALPNGRDLVGFRQFLVTAPSTSEPTPEEIRAVERGA
jgi:hypothetical protein